jgi:hypothetical protein
MNDMYERTVARYGLTEAQLKGPAHKGSEVTLREWLMDPGKDYRVRQPWEEARLTPGKDVGEGLFKDPSATLPWRIDEVTIRPPKSNYHFLWQSKGIYGTAPHARNRGNKRKFTSGPVEYSEDACADLGACFGCKWIFLPHIHTPLCGGASFKFTPRPSPNSPLWYGCSAPNPTVEKCLRAPSDILSEHNNWWCFGSWWCRSPEVAPTFYLRICKMCSKQFRMAVPKEDRWWDHTRTWDPYNCNACWAYALVLEDEVVGQYMS